METFGHDDDVRRSMWWWTAGGGFLLTIAAGLAYLANLPDEALARADQLGSVGSLGVGVLALLVALVSLRAATRPDGGRQRPESHQPSSTAAPSPKIWNVPMRNRSFLGREELLAALHDRLSGGGTAVVQAFHGMGGVGKTQLAIEYAHRFSADYDLVWWFAAEKPELIGDQYVTLAIQADLVGFDTDSETAIGKVKTYLRRHDRWLLLFDNAEDPARLLPWLTEGPGHVVITSRNPNWGEVAEPVAVDIFTRAESITLLRSRLPHLAADEIDQLADALGDLPLGLAQAAGTIAETAMSATDYRAALAAKASQVLDHSPPPTYPVSLAAAIRLSVDQLADGDPIAWDLLQLCAWLAPEPIPVALLANAWEDSLLLHRAVGRIGRFGLARVDADSLQLHRLTQAILRDFADAGARNRVQELLVAAGPDNGSDPEHWTRWAQLVPHILAVDPADSTSEELRDLATRMLWYMINRGDVHTARDLARHYRDRWLAAFGPYDPATLWATNHLGQAFSFLGEHAQARPFDEEVFRRYREIHGADHPFTLTSANNLANTLLKLDELQAARDLHEDTHRRRRRVLGDDHPNTLTSANGLANVMRELGELQRARELHEDVLSRRRRVLGYDHLRTFHTANSLAEDLRALGALQAARELLEDTLTRQRRVLGEDHSEALQSAISLAAVLSALGETKAAQRLEKDVVVRQRLAAGHAREPHGDDQPRGGHGAG